MVAAWPSSFSSSPRSPSSRSSRFGAQAFLLLDGGAVALALVGDLLGIAAQTFQFQARDREARIGARQIVAQLAHFVVERDPVLLARLLQGAQALQFGFEPDDLLVEHVQPREHLVERALAAAQAHGELARFALHGQRPGAGLLAAGDGVAVVADAIGQQEVEVRVADREALRGGAVVGQEAEADARHQVDGAVLEAVGQAQRIAEPRGDAGFRSDGRLGQMAAMVAVGFRVDQEGGAPVELRADEIQAALGLLPVLHHHVFQLFVEELFGGFFELRVRPPRSRPARRAA